MAYFRDLVEHFNDSEPDVKPLEGYPERNVEWFKEKILPDFLSIKEKYNLGPTLIDIGCAFGYFTKEYAQHFDSVIGVDFSDKRIYTAKMENITSNTDYRLLNLVDSPLGGDLMDTAVSTAVYQHIDPDTERRSAFQHTADSLKDGGYLVLYDEDLTTRNELWNGFYQPLDVEWVTENLAGIFELLEHTLICRGNHGEYIYRWVLKKV